MVVWDLKGGKVTYKFTEATDEVHTLAWSPAAEGVLASGCHDAVVRKKKHTAAPRTPP